MEESFHWWTCLFIKTFTPGTSAAGVHPSPTTFTVCKQLAVFNGKEMKSKYSTVFRMYIGSFSTDQ
jgi:hypothetical protein